MVPPSRTTITESWIEAGVRFVSVLTPPLGLVDFGVAPVIGERLAECSKELGIVGARREDVRDSRPSGKAGSCRL